MPVAFSYIRYSSPEQAKGDSFRRQLGVSKAWCQRNGYILDESLNIGRLNASAFNGANAETGRLKSFLDAIKENRVPQGSALLLENLDRLTRDRIRPALNLLLSILEAGISVVTVEPEMIFRPDGVEGDNDMGQLMIAIAYLARGHGESERKSKTMGPVWAEKRANAATSKMTKRAPYWLRLTDDRSKFVEIPDRALVVKRIFRMAGDGSGATEICKALNGDGVPTWTKETGWHRSYILKILKNRAVLGEMQPFKGRNSKERRPDGEVIKGYFPSVVSEADFYRAQSAMQSRKKKQNGPIGIGVANLFTGLIKDARDGAPMVLQSKDGRNPTHRILVSSAGARGVAGSKYIPFSYSAFETAMLEWTKEVKSAQLFGGNAGSVADNLVASEGKLREIDERLEAFRESLETDPDYRTLIKVVRKLEGDREELVKTIESLKEELHTSKDRNLDHALDLISMMKRAEGNDLIELRTRLRAAFSTLISEIWMGIQILDDKWTRQAMVQVHFSQGGYRRFVVYTVKGKYQKWEDGAPLGSSDLQHGELADDLRTIRF